VAPIRTLATTARALGYTYASIDLRSAIAEVRGDLCALPFADACFDVVVCFHVLEHISADRSAVQELARVVGRNGETIVVVPWEKDRKVTFEDPDAEPADYERLYGQSDHVRIYGREVTERWRDTGIEVEEILWSEVFGAEEHRRAALQGDDDRFWMLRAP
jgi:SAM-dependent methyltransferase